MAQSIAAKLLGEKIVEKPQSEEDFINREFKDISLDKLQLEPLVVEVLNQRLQEIRKSMNTDCPLSVIFLCGSALEGILLGVAKNNAQKI